MTGRRRDVLLASVIFVTAFAARIVPVLQGGGLHGLLTYDDGVYYAAAAALGFGRIPYRDFVLLHPPGIMLALSPFATLGRLTTDSFGFTAARLAFTGIGALNAVLAWRIARRFGPIAGLTAGLFYALWFPATSAEHTARLEVLVNAALLTGLLLLVRPQGKVSPRSQVWAGVALGFGASVKIWGIVPWVVVVGWQLIAGGRRAAVRVLAGGLAALVVVCGPFFALAPREMTRMVVFDQLDRPARLPSPITRLLDITSVSTHLPHAAPRAQYIALAVIGLLILAASAICLLQQGMRVLPVLLAAQTLVLLLSPSYFGFYASFVAVPLALVAGNATQLVTSWISVRVGAVTQALPAVTASVIVLAGLVSATIAQGQGFPAARLATAIPPGCVTADDDNGLIQLNVLTRDLSAGCPVMVDVSGLTYDRDARRSPTGQPLPRSRNPAWQLDALRYLTSGSSVILLRGNSGDGWSRSTKRALARLPDLAVVDGFHLRRGHGEASP